MTFCKGDIFLIKDYQFEDGKGVRDKYLIVVSVDQSINIVRSLTSSAQKIPDNKIQHGCCNSLDGQFSHYIFLQDRKICDNGFSFRLNTFIYYPNNVLEIPISHILDHKIISHQGTLTDAEYHRFCKCLLSSKHVTRGIKRILEAQLNFITLPK